MTRRIAIVGDVHGNIQALSSLLAQLRRRTDTTVLVGDYVNRGPASADVIDLLIAERERYPVVCLAGNHELALLDALNSGDITRLLHMGGAPTITSYIGAVQGDVAGQFQRAVPQGHRDFLASLSETFSHERLLVTHEPRRNPPGPMFHVYGHIVQRTLLPLVRASSAAIDTGCGTLPDGRLTALFWPDLAVTQVEADGQLVED